MGKLTAVIVTSVLLAACSGGGSDATPPETPAAATSTIVDPETFIDDYYEIAVNGQFGKVWDTLHPAQQALVSRGAYMDCQQSTTPAPTDVKVKVIDTFPEPVDIPGTDLVAVPATALTLEITYGGSSVRRTVHLVDVDGQWRTLLTSESLAQCGHPVT
jgi:hypothetical protein